MQYNLLGIIFILYGVIKLVLITAIMSIPPSIKEKLAKIEGFNMLISTDKTISGKMYEYVLFVFAVFSIVHGMALLGIFSDNFRRIIESKELQYPFYTVLGLWLLIFYAIVIYTDAPIKKDPKNMYNYKIYGYLGGLSFLLVPPIWELIEYFNPYLDRMKQEQQLAYMTLVMFGLLFVIFLTYVVIKRMRKMKRDTEEQIAKKEKEQENTQK